MGDFKKSKDKYIINRSKYILNLLGKDDTEEKMTLNIEIIKKVPLMIRNNGLVETLKYLSEKKDSSVNNIEKVINKYILYSFNITCDNDSLSMIENLKSNKYMELQKEIYQFSIELKNLIVIMDK